MRSLRRHASIGSLVTGLALAVSVPALTGTVTAAEVRTETDLGGFFAEAEAAPARVLVDDPAVPIPRPPGAAVVEADPSYTYATFNTGPTSRSTASTLWPGNLLGTGLPQVAEGAPAYPLAANSSFPGGPTSASIDGQAFSMTSQALGLDVTATAATRGAPPEGSAALIIGTADSTSSVTTVKDDKSPDAVKDVSVARAVSRVSDLTILGVINIDSVVTTLEARSDAVAGTSSGSTVVSGLEVMGQGYTVDEKGVRPIGQPPLPLPGVGTVVDPLKQLGVTIESVSAVSSDSGVQGSRVSRGLRITVDTVVLRQTLNMVPALNDTLGEVFAGVPAIPNVPAALQPKGLLFYTLSATPKITYLIGAANVTSSASLPLNVDFGDLTDPPLFPGTPGTPGTPGSPGTPGTAGFTPVDGGSLPDPTVAGVGTPPGGDGQPVTGVLAAGTPFDGAFEGLGPMLLLGGLLLAFAGARGLLGLQAAALGGGLLGAGCALGAPEDLPDLRAATDTPAAKDAP